MLRKACVAPKRTLFFWGKPCVLFGTLQEFQPENDSITAYFERAEVFFQANDIAEDKKVAILLSVIGARSYALLRTLVAPDFPQEKSFGDLKTLLK